MFARRIASNIPRVRAQASLFHSTAPAFVQKGDAIPNLDVLVENSPGNKVNLAKEIKNKAVIIGTPAAFSTWIHPTLLATLVGNKNSHSGLTFFKAPRAPAPTFPASSTTPSSRRLVRLSSSLSTTPSCKLEISTCRAKDLLEHLLTRSYHIGPRLGLIPSIPPARAA